MSVWRDKQRGDWVYSFRYRGERKTKRGHKNRDEALEAQAKKKRALKFGRKQTLPDTALSLVASLYLDHAERHFAPKTYQGKKMMIGKFLQAVGDKDLFEVQPYEIEKFLDTRPSNHNFNVGHKELSAMFHYAIKTLKIPVTNPCKDVSRMPDPDAVKYVPPQDDVLKLLMAAGKDRPLLQVVIGTMGRIDEILRMKWIDVNWKTRSVRLWTRKAKDGSWRHDDVSANESLMVILKALYDVRIQEEWVFFNTKTKTRFTRRPKLMRKICKAAKIKPFGFHALRHFAASMLANDPKIAKKTISGLLRHRSLATTEIYLHSIEESQREAVKALDGIMVATFGCDLQPKQTETAETAESKGAK